jgi:hypothetical protein
VDVNGTPMIVDLFDDPRQAPAGSLNEPFKRWTATLSHWQQRGPIEIKRIAHGMDADALFGFMAPIKIELQGPFTSTVNDGGQMKEALPFLHDPPKSALVHLQGDDAGSDEFSDSHTINGHSLAFRLTYGNVRFNFTGDLNQESMAILRQRLPLQELEAEIVKAPHHGSAEFDFEALKAMRPVVSLVSSGDESAGKEHIHPRATFVSALGRVSRGDTGIVLCTELVAFFAMREESHQREKIAKFYDGDDATTITRGDLHKFYDEMPRTSDNFKKLPSYFGFERTNFGIIHVRTDGERVLVFTHSGKKGMREAYRFTVDANHEITFAKDVTTG